MNGTKNKLKFTALDTNVFVYYFDQNPQFGESAKEIFDQLSTGSLKAVTSVVALIELLSHKVLSIKAAREIESKFYGIPNLAVREVDRQLATEAARIRRKYGFRTPDAIQLATAVQAKAKAFITNDERLKQFKELKVLLLPEVQT